MGCADGDKRAGPDARAQLAAPSQRGQQAEDAACERLRRAGLRILRRNYRVRGGEVDIVALDGQVLVFVEVRCRRHAGWGGAAASVDARKRAHLVLAARHYLACADTHPQQPVCRFDVVAIDGARLRWIRDAFDAPGRVRPGWHG
jgi:putative endonuclease